MNRRIFYVLLFSLLYHFGYRPAFAADMMHGSHKSPIATVGYKDKTICQDSSDYFQVETCSLLNESEDEEEVAPVSKSTTLSRWSLYQCLKASPLAGKKGAYHYSCITTPDKEKYILIRSLRI